MNFLESNTLSLILRMPIRSILLPHSAALGGIAGNLISCRSIMGTRLSQENLERE